MAGHHCKLRWHDLHRSIETRSGIAGSLLNDEVSLLVALTNILILRRLRSSRLKGP